MISPDITLTVNVSPFALSVAVSRFAYAIRAHRLLARICIAGSNIYPDSFSRFPYGGHAVRTVGSGVRPSGFTPDVKLHRACLRCTVAKRPVFPRARSALPPLSTFVWNLAITVAGGRYLSKCRRTNYGFFYDLARGNARRD